MRSDYVYFKELLLAENNKFTLDFSDEVFVQEVDFLSKNKYYMTSLNCKLKVKEYIHDKDKKIKTLSVKTKLLLENGLSYQIDLHYLLLESLWYVKRINHSYRFKLYPQIIDQYSYKNKFWDTTEKRSRDCQICFPSSQLIEKGFDFERELIINNEFNSSVRLTTKTY